MGTTRTAIEAGDHGQLAFIMALEGYENLIHDGAATDAAIVTAWSGSGYTAAIKGLERPGKISQKFTPFRARIDGQNLQLVVMPDEDDTFGVAVAKTDSADGNWARLNASADCDDPVLTWADTSSLAASGTLYIGTERTTYSGKTAITTAGHDRGLPAPFHGGGTSGARWGRPHRVSQTAGAPLVHPYGADWPHRWVGRWVGVWVARIVGGVVDVLAQAELIWAGTIADIKESTRPATVIVSTDAKTRIGNYPLLGNQFNAQPQEGIDLTANDTILFREKGLKAGALVLNEATLTVGTGGYIDVGRRTTDEIMSGINEFLQANHGGVVLDAIWSILLISGNRCNFIAQFSGADYTIRIDALMSRSIAGMLGFDLEAPTASSPIPPYDPWYYGVEDSGTNPFVGLTGVLPVGYGVGVPHNGQKLYLAAPNGSWIDQSEQVPQPWKNRHGTAGGDWGFLRYRDFVMLAERTSDTEFTVYWDRALLRMFQQTDPELAVKHDDYGRLTDNSVFIRVDEIPPDVTQIVFMQDRASELIPRLIASTGTAGYNHATYDEFDYQLGAAIPWDLLGDNFVNTVEALQQQSPDYIMTLLLEKKTELREVLASEMLLRGAALVFRDGGLMFSTPSSPTSSSATHTFTESDKAAAMEEEAPDALLTETESTDRLRTSSIKVEYNRDFRGEYHNVLEISDEAAATDYGPARPWTLEARNVVSGNRSTNMDPIRLLISDLAADALGMFSRPIPVSNVRCAPSKFFIAPGDTVAFSDDFVRDRTTGEHGIAAVPTWAVGIVQDWQKMRGSLDLALMQDGASRRAIYSPSAFVDAGQATDGYDHGNKYIYLVAHEFSLSSEDKDLESFEVDDLVTLMQRSAAAPTLYNRQLTAVDAANDRVTLDSALPAAGSLTGNEWYIVSRVRSAAAATQKTDAYMADEADGLILDLVRAKIYGKNPLEVESIAAGTTTALHEYPATTDWKTEDYPVTPAMHRAMIRSTNGFINRKSAISTPILLESPETISATAYKLVMLPFEVYVGDGVHPFMLRKLAIGPILERKTGTGICTVRITSSAARPHGASNLVDATFSGITVSQTWTHSGAGFANVARQLLDVVVAAAQPVTWISVEAKIDSGTYDFFGLHEFWQRQLETP